MLEDVMHDLTDPCGEIAVIVEMLRQHSQTVTNLMTGPGGTVIDVHGRRPKAAQERCTGGIAYWILYEGVLKAHTFGSKTIEVRRLHGRVL